jgi:NitT/TauT family transport system ATP-binding protein
MTADSIQVENVSKTYVSPRNGEEVEALRGVSLTVHSHEFVAIVGPSGCGKSTLLSLVAGLLRPSAGVVLFDGAPVSGPGPERGVLFQDYALFPWLTVRDNVGFGPRARGLARDERERISREYIRLVGLSGFEGKYPCELSGGMRQRCALARMLANEPRVWLMDEPFAAVDLQTRMLLQQELLRLWGDDRETRSRRPVMFVTHGIDEAVFLADRVLVLGRRPGRLKAAIDIDLARPRAKHRNSPAIGVLVERIWELIRDEAAEAMIDE